MILERNVSIFDSGAEVLVNPVNCVGVMGAGLALAFKKNFPHCYPPYAEACRKKSLRPGSILLIAPQGTFPGILCFPTKDHWRKPSRLEWVEAGLACIAENATKWGVGSLAMPLIGCGLGGLLWNDVRQAIHRHLDTAPVSVTICIP
jgi:O-acetyl-ADP-ribose deacetylase (regulator of RNase III)